MALPGDTATLALERSRTAVPDRRGKPKAPPSTPPGEKIVSNEMPGARSARSRAAQVQPGRRSESTRPLSLAGVDLWDSGWPSGRFYWTVVPVAAQTPPAKTKPATTTTAPTTTTATPTTTTTAPATDPAADGTAATATGEPITYHDMAVPQDSCEAGLGMSFGKISKPVVASAGKPYLSGVQPSSRMVAAAGKSAVVLNSPIIAWEPAVGATMYQVELSRSFYPWRPARHVKTPSTSVTLPLTKYDIGTWFYRVRGINDALPAGARKMTWSKVLRVRITGDQFAIVK